MKRVALVDDNPLVLESLQKTIPWANLGCEAPACFGTGKAAFEWCAQNRPGLIITDIKMPGMDGLALIEKLQGVYGDFACVVITGFDEFAYAHRALRLGAVDLILKPIDNAELAAAILRADGQAGAQSATQPPTHPASGEEAPPAAPKPLLQKQYAASVRRALVYMQSNLDKRVSLVELADFVGLSSAHLSRLLKKETGKNFVDINNQMRIDKAIELLSEGKHKIYEVSGMVGIDNYAYFYQLFKKVTGKTPKEYQKYQNS